MTRKRRLLTVFAPNKGGQTGFCASMVWYADGQGRWRIERSAPVLKWLEHHHGTQGVAFFLKGPARRAGWSYEWQRLPAL